MAGRLATWGAAAALVCTALPAAGQSKTAKDTSEITVIGCVELEKDYRAALGAAKGGPLSSGAGQKDEYVLVASKAAPATGSTQTQQEAVATAGLSGDYLLSGKTEDELKRAIGRQVEVVGKVEPFRANKNAKEDRDRLPRLSITTWHPVNDFCPAKTK
jgi:hypothetical protein